jgi:hypothetical protein
VSEEYYGVTFEDQETTYLVGLFDVRGDAEDYLETLEEEETERVASAGGEPITYDIVEIDPGTIDASYIREQLELGPVPLD